MSTAVLSIGSNMEEPHAQLQGALELHRLWLVAASPVYQTSPWGPLPQPDYLNAVLLVHDCGAQPLDWLARARAAEDVAGRRRRQRWGPRTLDVDVIAVDEVISDDPELTLPHPRAAQRAFVLVPWLDVQPDARLQGRSVAELLAALTPQERDGVRVRHDLALS